MGRLTQAKIRALEPGPKPTLHFTGEPTLYVLVQPGGGRSFVQRLHIGGRPTDLGLGSCGLVTLQEARDLAIDNRRVAHRGGDPRRRANPTVATALEKVIEIQRGAWKDGGKSEKQWRASMSAYAKPILDKRVSDVDATDVLDVLAPIWNEKRETARRLKHRIRAVMEWARGQKFRTDNPVDAVAASLPKTGRKVNHHKALPFDQVGTALDIVESSDAWWATKAAFRFMVLTAARSGEVRLMTWEELDGDVWTVPGERMKAGREHRVPLSREAMAIIDQARTYADSSGLVFPSARSKALSDSTMSKLIRELGIQAVPHGFRSSAPGFLRGTLYGRAKRNSRTCTGAH